jgi:hypothetical protein
LVDLQSAAKKACEADLKAYDQDYYGDGTPAPKVEGKASQGLSEQDADFSLAFLGPIGSLIDSFVSIIQPIIIDASVAVDEFRRQAVIVAALRDPKTKPQLLASGKALSVAIDAYNASQKHTLTGAFVEELVAIRTAPINLSKDAECARAASDPRLPSGAPSASFISCWKSAWAILRPMVDDLNTIGDDYDNLADNGTTSATKLFGTIMADYDQIDAGKSDATAIFWDDITQFITLANAIASAASQSNITKLQKAAAAVAH